MCERAALLGGDLSARPPRRRLPRRRRAASARAGGALLPVYVRGVAEVRIADVDTDLGFCAKGEGGPFVAVGHIDPGGTVVVIPTGGGLSDLHPGMPGLYLVLEAVEQLRGAAGVLQVPNASLSLVHGMGMTLTAHATALLAVEP